MHKFSVEEKLMKIMQKLSKKNPSLFDALTNKIDEIVHCENVNHYKNLRKPLQHLKSVHVGSSFVLTFRYIESEDKILFYNFDHHDKVYM